MIIVSFASHGYEKWQDQLGRCCKRFGISHCGYSEDWLKSTPEYHEHLDLFSSRRGFGFWAWKPLVILDALQCYQEPVIYCDSAVIFDVDPTPIVDKISCIGVYTTDRTPGHPVDPPEYINHTWVKRDAFVLTECDSEKYWSGIHIWAGVVVARDIAKPFIREWLKYSLDRRIVSDDPNVCYLPNLPEFRDHRHDQAILSLMCLKYPWKVQYLEECFRDCAGEYDRYSV